MIDPKVAAKMVIYILDNLGCYPHWGCHPHNVSSQDKNDSDIHTEYLLNQICHIGKWLSYEIY